MAALELSAAVEAGQLSVVAVFPPAYIAAIASDRVEDTFHHPLSLKAVSLTVHLIYLVVPG